MIPEKTHSQLWKGKRDINREGRKESRSSVLAWLVCFSLGKNTFSCRSSNKKGERALEIRESYCISAPRAVLIKGEGRKASRQFEGNFKTRLQVRKKGPEKKRKEDQLRNACRDASDEEGKSVLPVKEERKKKGTL